MNTQCNNTGRNRSAAQQLLFALALVVSLTACKKDGATTVAAEPARATAPAPAEAPPAITIARVDLGTAVGADMKVAVPAALFKADDTIYAAVSTNGSAPGATLKATWSYEGSSVVYQQTQLLKNLTGPTAIDFSLPNSGGYKIGVYKIEVSIDGKPAAVTEFVVTK